MSDDSSSAASDNEEKQPTTIADDIVVTKYKMASDITNREFQFFKFFIFAN